MAFPNFSVTFNSVLSALNGGSLLSSLTSIVYPPYGIYYAKGERKGQPAIEFTSVLSFTPEGAAVMSSAPVEAVGNSAGSYSSFNKVAQPAKFTMRIALEGTSAFSGEIPNVTNFSMYSRADLIKALDNMRFKATVYNIETPDRVYANYDLVNYSFPVRPNSGITLLIVDLVFQEVRTSLDIISLGKSALKSTTTDVATPTKRIV